MVIETTNVNKLSALVSVLSLPVLFSIHSSSAFIPIIPFIAYIKVTIILYLAKVNGVWSSHKILHQQPSSQLTYALLQKTLSFLDAYNNTPSWVLPSSSNWQFFLLCFSGSSSSQVDVPQGLVFTSLSILSLLSEPVPMTLNTIYMLMTLNFL